MAAGPLLVGVCIASLVACGGNDTKTIDAPTTSATPTTAAGGTTLPGTRVRVGKPVKLDLTADASHTSKIALTVTSVSRGKIKDLRQFSLGDAARASTVYYVAAVVKNVGRGDLSGRRLTLYGKVSHDLVVPPVLFSTTFQRCDDRPLPGKFRRGAKTHLCMVMLAPKHGRISAVEWRGTRGAEPISWVVR